MNSVGQTLEQLPRYRAAAAAGRAFPHTFLLHTGFPDVMASGNPAAFPSLTLLADGSIALLKAMKIVKSKLITQSNNSSVAIGKNFSPKEARPSI
jgi:hypothetical protein